VVTDRALVRYRPSCWLDIHRASLEVRGTTALHVKVSGHFLVFSVMVATSNFVSPLLILTFTSQRPKRLKTSGRSHNFLTQLALAPPIVRHQILRCESKKTATYFVEVDDRFPEMILQLVEVSHADLPKVTRMVFIEVSSVVMLSTSHTTSTRMLAMLADTTVAGGDVTATAKRIDQSRALMGQRNGGRKQQIFAYCLRVFVNRVGMVEIDRRDVVVNAVRISRQKGKHWWAPRPSLSGLELSPINGDPCPCHAVSA